MKKTEGGRRERKRDGGTQINERRKDRKAAADEKRSAELKQSLMDQLNIDALLKLVQLH